MKYRVCGAGGLTWAGRVINVGQVIPDELVQRMQAVDNDDSPQKPFRRLLDMRKITEIGPGISGTSRPIVGQAPPWCQYNPQILQTKTLRDLEQIKLSHDPSMQPFLSGEEGRREAIAYLSEHYLSAMAQDTNTGKPRPPAPGPGNDEPRSATSITSAPAPAQPQQVNVPGANIPFPPAPVAASPPLTLDKT